MIGEYLMRMCVLMILECRKKDIRFYKYCLLKKKENLLTQYDKLTLGKIQKESTFLEIDKSDDIMNKKIVLN